MTKGHSGSQHRGVLIDAIAGALIGALLGGVDGAVAVRAGGAPVGLVADLGIHALLFGLLGPLFGAGWRTAPPHAHPVALGYKLLHWVRAPHNSSVRIPSTLWASLFAVIVGSPLIVRAANFAQTDIETPIFAAIIAAGGAALAAFGVALITVGIWAGANGFLKILPPVFRRPELHLVLAMAGLVTWISNGMRVGGLIVLALVVQPIIAQWIRAHRMRGAWIGLAIGLSLMAATLKVPAAVESIQAGAGSGQVILRILTKSGALP